MVIDDRSTDKQKRISGSCGELLHLLDNRFDSFAKSDGPLLGSRDRVELPEAHVVVGYVDVAVSEVVTFGPYFRFRLGPIGAREQERLDLCPAPGPRIASGMMFTAGAATSEGFVDLDPIAFPTFFAASKLPREDGKFISRFFARSQRPRRSARQWSCRERRPDVGYLRKTEDAELVAFRSRNDARLSSCRRWCL